MVRTIVALHGTVAKLEMVQCNMHWRIVTASRNLFDVTHELSSPRQQRIQRQILADDTDPRRGRRTHFRFVPAIGSCPDPAAFCKFGR